MTTSKLTVLPGMESCSPFTHRMIGPVHICTQGLGLGYYASCECGWTDGRPGRGDFVWHVEDRAKAHVATQHERRKGGGDRRSLLTGGQR